MRIFRRLFFLILTTLIFFLTPAEAALARFDPLGVPNNRYGIHILEPTELDLAANLVNSSGGDWGYVSIVIRSDDRDSKKWQRFFNDARTKHIIPIIRMATKTRDDYWEIPNEGEAQAWADFFGSLKWPTNNHYIIVYNEPNHAKEWGNTVDPQGYAKELAKTIEAIKQKDPDAFMLNAGFDASAPTVQDKYMDEVSYMEKMAEAAPGIFEKLDGWTSHSYPQPNFSGSPSDKGRNTIETYRWEQSILKDKFKINKLSVFITETGWANKSGIEDNPSYLSEDEVAKNFTKAFSEVWNDDNLVAVTPFTLTYREKPFDHFSWFRAPNFSANVLGVEDLRSLRNQYYIVQQLPKMKGKPVQKDGAKLVKLALPKSASINQLITGSITLENSGEAVWFTKDDQAKLTITIASDTSEYTLPLVSERPVQPGETYVAKFDLLTPAKTGEHGFRLAIKDRDNTLTSISYDLEVSTQNTGESLAQKLLLAVGKIIEKAKEKVS